MKSVTTTTRAVGFCLKPTCENYLKGVFLFLSNGTPFYCDRCRELGFIEKEKRIDYLSQEDESAVLTVYKTVKVHFNFNPMFKVYQEIAVVEIPELSVEGLYEIYSPLIKTKNRALKVAEFTLCMINSGIKDRHTGESVINLGDKNWKQQLKQLEYQLCERERRIISAFK